jgi:hypothetical protein
VFETVDLYWMLNILFVDMFSYKIVQGVSVNRAILQHCFFWFGNTAADFDFNVLNC